MFLATTIYQCLFGVVKPTVVMCTQFFSSHLFTKKTCPFKCSDLAWFIEKSFANFDPFKSSNWICSCADATIRKVIYKSMRNAPQNLIHSKWFFRNLFKTLWLWLSHSYRLQQQQKRIGYRNFHFNSFRLLMEILPTIFCVHLLQFFA